MAIDWTKPIETTDGMPARLLAKLRGPARFPYVVSYEFASDTDGITMVNEDGDGGSIILRNKRTKREGWINIYPGTSNFSEKYAQNLHYYSVYLSPPFKTEAIAIERRLDGCLATVKIEWEE